MIASASTSWSRGTHAGLRILQASHDGGEAYFRLQSTRGEDILDTLSARVELSKVGEVLRLYCKALTGRNVSIQTTASLAEKGIGWVDEHRASTEGSTIFLPELMEQYPEKDENFAAIKVFATHQAAHIEFGSFDFACGPARGRVRGTSARQFDGLARSADHDRHGALLRPIFPDRQLASDLYTIAEDSRIDAAIEARVRRDPALVDAHADAKRWQRRPDVRQLPLRQGFVENLVRGSLDGVGRGALADDRAAKRWRARSASCADVGSHRSTSSRIAPRRR